MSSNCGRRYEEGTMASCGSRGEAETRKTTRKRRQAAGEIEREVKDG